MLDKANVAYYVKNGSTYVTLNVTDGTIVWDGANGDDLYVVVTATENFDATVQIAHVHQITYRGECSVSGCTKSDKIFITVDNAVRAQYKLGETYYYFVEFPGEGKSFKVTLEGAAGEVVIYEAKGDVATPDENGIIIAKKMCYYIVVTATADSDATAKLTFEQVG